MKLTTELLHQLKSSAQEEIMCREASDTSDAWQDLASPENILALIEIALPVLEQQGGWISCSERMPPDSKAVLTWDGVFEEIRHTICGNWQCWQPGKITHWQPLPAPPRPQPAATPQIDNDGWIEWGGGNEAPVTGMVEVRLRSCSNARKAEPATDWVWKHRGTGDDIIAYRVIENDGREG